MEAEYFIERPAIGEDRLLVHFGHLDYRSPFPNSRLVEAAG
jgi:hypothetical protein